MITQRDQLLAKMDGLWAELTETWGMILSHGSDGTGRAAMLRHGEVKAEMQDILQQCGELPI